MKIHKLREIHVSAGLLLAVAGSVGLVADSISAAPRPTATMLGRATVKRKNLGTTTSLGANDRLYPGDIVATGGAAGATVQFSDGSRVDMAGRSVMEIASPVSVGGGKTLFRALNGRMAAHLRPGKVVATRTSLVRVKGTVILISVEDDGTSTLSVLEGAAEFFNPCGSVIVPAGAESVARPGNAPTAPSAIPDVQALLRNWQNQNDVLAPFVTPNANLPVLQPTSLDPTSLDPTALQPALVPPVAMLPSANIIGNGRLDAPAWGIPDYLREAAAKLDAMPLGDHLVFASTLASLKPKSQASANGRDCGCGGVKASK